VAAKDEVDRARLQGDHQIGVFLAWNPKNPLDPLGFEAADEEIGCFHGC